MTDRSRLRMDDTEVWEFLASCSVAEVSGFGPAGLTARRAALAVVGRQIELSVVPSEVAFDLDRHPDVCVCVDRYPSPTTIRGVVAHGQARWTEGSTMVVTVERVVSFDFTKSGFP